MFFGTISVFGCYAMIRETMLSVFVSEEFSKEFELRYSRNRETTTGDFEKLTKAQVWEELQSRVV